MTTSIDTAPPEQLERLVKSGANWFYWIAGLSLVNTVSQLSGSTFTFIAGLGITQVFDGIATTGGPLLHFVCFAANLGAAAIFVVLGYVARRESVAYAAGMCLYALDGFIFLWAQAWLGLGLHIFVLFFASVGYQALKRLHTLSPLAPKCTAPPVAFPAGRVPASLEHFPATGASGTCCGRALLAPGPLCVHCQA